MTETISLELARKLDAAGWRGETALLWHVPETDPDIPTIMDNNEGNIWAQVCEDDELLPASTFTEILRDLPIRIGSQNWFADMERGQFRNGYGGEPKTYKVHESPTEAAGNLLLWCIENGHVEVTP